MKTPLSFLAAITLLGCSSLGAQQVGASASADDSAKTTFAPAAAGFGDNAASRSWEMSSVTGELQGKLDTKTAKPGDRVTLKTTDKVQVSDGTVIPRGSRLLGHITELQAHNNDRAIAQVGIAFDHVELKNGQSIAVHSLIRTLRPSASVASMSPMGSDDSMSASSMGGGRMSSRSGAGIGGALGASGNATTAAGNLGGGTVAGTVDRSGTSNAGGTGADIGTGAGPTLDAGVNAREDSAVQLAGHGDNTADRGVHAAAAQRSVPHPTGIPGIMLAGSSSSSGLLLNADRREIEFDSGTRFELGIVADH